MVQQLIPFVGICGYAKWESSRISAYLGNNQNATHNKLTEMNASIGTNQKATQNELKELKTSMKAIRLKQREIKA